MPSSPPAKPACPRLPDLAVLLALMATGLAAVAEETACPPPASASPGAAAAAPSVRGPMEVEARRIEGDRRVGVNEFIGDVHLQQDAQRLFAEYLRYDEPQDRIEARGAVRLESPQGDTFVTERLELHLGTHTGETGPGTYRLGKTGGRGEAGRIEFAGRDLTLLYGARYTTCPPGQDDWFLEVERLELDSASQIGTARGVRVRYYGVPVFYFPYLNFPLSDERKSGFLVPRVGHSDKSGAEIAVPYYFNLAPNYDDTLTPRYLAKRGLQIRNEFRYLGRTLDGRLDLEYLPGDDLYGADRAAFHLRHQQSLAPRWSASVDLRAVSDKQYLEDFGDRLEITAQTHLPQNAELHYRGPLLVFDARASGYQTVNPAIAPLDRPYARLPELRLETTPRLAPNQVNPWFNAQWVNFERSAGVTGSRLNLAPGLSLPLATAWGFLTPRASLRHLAYDLNGVAAGGDETPSVTAGVFSLDGGLFLERTTTVGGRALTQTLEPRLFYLYVPYHEQDDLPLFDSGVPDLSFESLFREDRLVGGDRIADANQISAALTTRFLDETDGSERLRLSLGRIYYLADRRVNLPAGTDTARASDYVAEASARLPANLAARAFLQWDPHQNRAARASFSLQYMPARDRIANLGYQFIRDRIEQLDASTEWPLGPRLALRARTLYSLREDRNLESYAGLVYHRCCWALRLFASRRLSGGTAQVNGIHVEFELTGLGKLGEAPASPLAQGLFSFPPETADKKK